MGWTVCTPTHGDNRRRKVKQYDKDDGEERETHNCIEEESVQSMGI